MIVSLISCINLYYGIGYNSKAFIIPEHLKRLEMVEYRPVIIDHTVGLFPNSDNIVLCDDINCKVGGAFVANSFRHAFSYCRNKYSNDVEVFICGGADLYNKMYSTCDYIYLTLMHNTWEADSFFPKIDYSKFEIVKQEYCKTDKGSFKLLDLKRIKF